MEVSESTGIIKLSRREMPYPLCIVGDRYDGTYSGAEFLAFNLYPEFVARLPIDDDDINCADFWRGNHPDYDLDDFIIGKGSTPDLAVLDLIKLLKAKRSVNY